MSRSGLLFIRKTTPRPELSLPTRPTRAGNLVTWGPEVHFSVTNIVQADWGIFLRPDGTVVSTNATAGLTGVVDVGPFWVIKEDGSLVSWGTNPDHTSLAAPNDLSNVVEMAYGGFDVYNTSLFALRRDGSLVTWPYASRLPLNPEPSIAIAAGIQHVSALRADGSVATWGSRYTASMPETFPLIQPPGLSNVVDITAISSKSIALKTDGTLIAWGSVYNYEQAEPPSSAANAIAIAGSTILKSDGSVIDWGPVNYERNWMRPPTSLSNVISIAPYAAIVGAAEIKAEPPLLEPINILQSAVTFHIAWTPGATYSISGRNNPTNSAPTNFVLIAPTILATNTLYSVQISNLAGIPPYIDKFVMQAKATATIDNGKVTGVSIAPFSNATYPSLPGIRFVGGEPDRPATGVGVLKNGELSSITITDPGSGYNSAPVVEIEPPVMTPPTVSTSVDRMTMFRRTEPGHVYQFESSSDLLDWIAITSPTVAQTDQTSLDVSVTETKRFYRLIELR
jgi:hypothetical protein